MESEIFTVKISLEKLTKKFGPWLVQQMDHSGLPLYLILNGSEIEILSGAEPIGLEVNLPSGLDVYTGKDVSDRGRKKRRVDLVFKKGDTYYLVEIIDKKNIPSKVKKDLKEKARRFKESLGITATIQVVPIIVQPEESIPSVRWLIERKE